MIHSQVEDLTIHSAEQQIHLLEAETHSVQ